MLRIFKHFGKLYSSCATGRYKPILFLFLLRFLFYCKLEINFCIFSAQKALKFLLDVVLAFPRIKIIYLLCRHFQISCIFECATVCLKMLCFQVLFVRDSDGVICGILRIIRKHLLYDVCKKFRNRKLGHKTVMDHDCNMKQSVYFYYSSLRLVENLDFGFRAPSRALNPSRQCYFWKTSCSFLLPVRKFEMACFYGVFT